MLYSSKSSTCHIRPFIFLVILLIISLDALGASPIKIMPLGDSITRGYWGSSYGDGYRRALYKSLVGTGFYSIDFVGSLTDGYFQDFDRNHEGHDGWTTDGLSTNVYNWLTANPAQIVLLHIGTNDITLAPNHIGDPNKVAAILNEIDRYSTDITVILARIILRTDGYVPQTIAFNNGVVAMAQARIAAGDKIIIVDMENALSYPADMYDVVHPNDSGYRKMATVWFNALQSFLPQQYEYVKVNASSLTVAEYATAPEKFVISRNTTSGDTAVRFELSGTAVYSIDYNTIPDTNIVTIPDGSSSVDVLINPINNNDYVGDSTIDITILEDPNYNVGISSTAKLFLLEDEPKGDIDVDGCVTCLDLYYFLSYAWLMEGENLFGDFYPDGIVNFPDYAVFSGDWMFCEPFSVKITQPSFGDYFPPSTRYIDILVDAQSSAGSITKVAFYANLDFIGEGTLKTDGWTLTWKTFEKGKNYYLIAVGYDSAGNIQVSSVVGIVTGS